MALVDYQKSGEISEWNEGTLKSIRMHQAQDLINRTIINPLQKSSESGVAKYNFELWFDAVNILFKEGMAKYAESEYNEIKALKEEIEKLISDKFPCQLKKTYHNGKYCSTVIVNKEFWRELKKKIEDFEYNVKFYNDRHGLSTRNMGTKGLFG